MRNVIILGGGPAGLTAAVYAARANLAPLVIEGSSAGGQLMLTTEVENYPGFETGIMGPVLMQTMRKQAERVGAEFLTEDVEEANFENRPFTVKTQSGHRVEGRAIIVATGASPKLLGLPGEQRLMGRGVSTCATCDGFFFRNLNVIVAGGGDSAMEVGALPRNLANSAHVIHRRDRCGQARPCSSICLRPSQDQLRAEHRDRGHPRERGCDRRAVAQHAARRPAGRRCVRRDRTYPEHGCVQGPTRAERVRLCETSRPLSDERRRRLCRRRRA